MKRIMDKVLKYVSIVLPLVVMVAGIAWVIYAGYFIEGSILNFCLLAVFFLFSLFLVPTLHELGHFAVGKILGMQLIAVNFSFLEIVKREDKFQISFVNPFLSDIAGYCCMYPVGEGDVKAQFILFSAGGLILQGIYLLICLPLVILLNVPLLWATLGATLPYCLYIFLVNVFPFSQDYDGYKIFGLLKDDPSALTFLRLFSLQGYLAQGFTPGEIEEELYFNLPQLPEDDANFILLQYYRYMYYLDSKNSKKAVKTIMRLEDCLDYVSQDFLFQLYCELIFVYAYILKEKEPAEHYHALIEQVKNNAHDKEKFRAELAYAKLCGNQGRVEELSFLYESEIEKEKLSGLKTYERNLWN